jgi:hypothetical protein
VKKLKGKEYKEHMARYAEMRKKWIPEDPEAVDRSRKAVEEWFQAGRAEYEAEYGHPFVMTVKGLLESQKLLKEIDADEDLFKDLPRINKEQ